MAARETGQPWLIGGVLTLFIAIAGLQFVWAVVRSQYARER